MFIKQTTITIEEALEFFAKNKLHKFLEIEFLEFLKKFGFNKIEQKKEPAFPDREFLSNRFFYPDVNFIAVKYSNVELVALCNAFRPWEHEWSLPALYDLCAMLVENEIPSTDPNYNNLTSFIENTPKYVCGDSDENDFSDVVKIYNFSKHKYEKTIEQIFTGVCRDIKPCVIDYKSRVFYYTGDQTSLPPQVYADNILNKLNSINVLFNLGISRFSETDKWEQLDISIKRNSLYVFPKQ